MKNKKILITDSAWVVPDKIDVTEFDFSWKPNPYDPPFIHQFGTQHQKTGGPRYIVTGATDVKYHDSQRAIALCTKGARVWRNASNVEFDFSWLPDETEPAFIYQFGTQHQKTGGPRYVVPGATQIKYMAEPKAVALPSMHNWIVPENLDTTAFDFSWTPDETEPAFIYQFGTQHQKTGGPRYVVTGATDIKYIDTQYAITTYADKKKFTVLGNISIEHFDYTWHPDSTDEPFIYQFGNTYYAAEVMPTIEYVVPGATEIKYVKSPVAKLTPNMEHWIIPDNIDTKDFDFSWVPHPNDPPFIYEFGTQWQKTGGPKYIVTDATQIKYIDVQRARMLPDRTNWEVLDSIDDSLMDFSWHPDSTSIPLTYNFGKEWRSGKEIALACYKIPGATETSSNNHKSSIVLKYKPIDIIFVSNGETGENERYQALCKAADREVKWVFGINGREKALTAAAKISTTDWLLVFPAKLLVNPDFDFDWQPNRMIDAKHYIFYATNPVNGLEYGHMAAVGYNKKLVLATKNYGLDFTMSKLHDIIPINSGIAEFNSDELMTWRTAFRESIKLKLSAESGNVECKNRLTQWLTVGNGPFNEYSLIGANHGVEYYNEVRGDTTLLQLSFSWDWLANRFKQHFDK